MIDLIFGVIAIICSLLLVINIKFYLFKLYKENRTEENIIVGAIFYSKLEDSHNYIENKTELTDLLLLSIIFIVSILVVDFSVTSGLIILIVFLSGVLVFFIEIIDVEYTMYKYNEEKLNNMYETINQT